LTPGKPRERRDAPIVEPFVDEGLGNSSYLIVSRPAKEAIVIDPIRDADRYVAAAKRHGADITQVLDTHLHADFLSGAREIAAATGATIAASAESDLQFEHRDLKDGDRLRVGDVAFDVLSTPGHTPEHVSFVMSNAAAGRPHSIFTGGALIVGGAARTDLLGPSLAEPLARQLYRTIRGKLLVLPDRTRVYPTHGAGSFCIASPTTRRTTTIGTERRTNPLAREQTEEEFVRRVTTGLPSYPSYFLKLRAINRSGPKVLGGVPVLPRLGAEEVRELTARGVAILDVRAADLFTAGHIAGSYGIDLNLGLAPWAGWLIPFGTPLVLVTASSEDRNEAVRELIRIGYDDLRGYVDADWEAIRGAGLPVERFPTVSPRALHDSLREPNPPVILDVRFAPEWDQGHIPKAMHVEAGALSEPPLPIDKDRPIVAHCVHGARSTAALSVLARRGYKQLALLEGGIAEWKAAGFDVERGTGRAR